MRLNEFYPTYRKPTKLKSYIKHPFEVVQYECTEFNYKYSKNFYYLYLDKDSDKSSCYVCDIEVKK
jgi:hypothetical protein